MIICGQLLLTEKNRPEQTRLSSGWLRVENGRIGEMESGECPYDTDFGGKECIVMPGFIDAHLHLSQFNCMNHRGMRLLPWLDQVVFPEEMKWGRSSYAATMTQQAIDQLLSHGTTSFAAYTTVHHHATLAAIEVCRQRGVRAAIGQVLMDFAAPVELCRPAEQLLEETAQLIEDYPSAGLSRVEAAITPRFALTCSPALLHGAGELAWQTGALVQTHLAETVSECERAIALHHARHYTQIYADMGLLTRRSILGHGIHLCDEQRRLLADAQSIVAHCPVANSFLSSGSMNRQALLDAGVRLALGSDIGAGTEISMVRNAAAMVRAAESLGHRPPTAKECFYQITTGNAEALGWSQVGRLEVGAEADILVLEPASDWQDTDAPLTHLFDSWDDNWLQTTIINGEVTMQML